VPAVTPSVASEGALEVDDDAVILTTSNRAA
jgi:hypothetical protein